MANLQLLPYAQQVAAIERQRKLANLLQEQGMQPSTTQMVSGIAVPTSPWESASKLAQNIASIYAQSKADEREAATKKQAREEANKQIQGFVEGIGPQKVVTQTPVMEQDFGQAATPEDYQNMMNNPQMGLAPKRRDMSQAATPEDVQDIVNQPYVTQDVTSYKPGMNRSQALAKLLEMKSSDNPYLADATSVLSGLMPKEMEIGAIDPSKYTPESLKNAMDANDPSLLRSSGSADKANWQMKTRTTYNKAGDEINQDYMFNPADQSIELVGKAYSGKPNIPTGINPMTLAQYNMEAEAFKNQWGYYPPGFPAGGPSTGTTPTGTSPSGRPLNAAQYRDFKSAEAAVNEAAGNFTNFRSVLDSISPSEGLVGEKSGQLATAFKAAQASIRLLQNTGVLNQGELPFLEETLADPQAFMSLTNPAARAKLSGQLQELDKLVQRKRANIYKQFEQPLPANQQPTANQNITNGNGFTDIAPGTEQYYQGG